MLLNYVKLAFRQLARSPFFSLINVVGLAVGFAAFYVLWGYSIHELKSDRYHKDADRIARIGVNWDWTDDNGKTWDHLTFGFAKSSLVPQFGSDYPEIESTLRVITPPSFAIGSVGHDNKVQISVDDQYGQRRSFKENRIAYADSNLFSFFTIPLIYGQRENVLDQPNDCTLSQSVAEKYFGEGDPTGKLVYLNDSTTLRVTGVFQDLPGHTHLNFNIAISSMAHITNWNTADFIGVVLYVKLKDSNFKEFEKKINRRSDEYWANVMRTEGNIQPSMFLQPLSEIPFSQNFTGDDFYPKSKAFLLTLTFISLSVLLMGWVNYVNLSITRLSRRGKEIATRKVSGARPGDIICQFVTESVLTNGIAILAAFTLIQAIKVPVLTILNIDIKPFVSTNVGTTVLSLIMLLSGILLTGLYPAIVSMSHQPRTLYAKTSSGLRKTIPNLLTTSQFVAAIVLSLLCFNISRQINFIIGKDIGIRQDRAIMLETPIVKSSDWLARMRVLKMELSHTPGVEKVSNSKFLPTRVGGGEFVARRVGSNLTFGMDHNSVDDAFVDFYGLKLIAGRKFVNDDQPQSILVSRFATTRLGFESPDHAVGSTIEVGHYRNWKQVIIIGVFEDYRNSPFLNASETSTESNDEGRGIILVNENNNVDRAYFPPEVVSVRLQPGDFDDILSAIEKIYARHFPGEPFAWTFLESKVAEIYRYEKFARNQVVFFTGLAILIACLGLVGMISNKVVEKTKEIGIRKVLGAGLHQIASILLSTTFGQIVAALLIGIPLAYHLSFKYLDKFSEHVSMDWWYNLSPVILLVVIMLATVASVIWKAAKSNPVEALKNE